MNRRIKSFLITSLIIGLFLCSFTVFARNIEQHTIEVDASSGLSFLSVTAEPKGGNDIDQDGFDIGGSALYYIFDNFGAGITFMYFQDEIKGRDITDTKETLNLFGPKIGYNFSLTENLSLKLQGSYLFTRGKLEQNDTFRSSGDGFNLGTQLSYFINDHISINGTLEYMSYTLEDRDSSYEEDVSGFGAGIGFSIYFR